MTEIFLIRHGQTDWNAARLYQGHRDIPLNQTGIDQAKVLALQLKDGQYDAIFSSDLSRAAMTAGILAESLSLTFVTDPRLREICQGVWEGMSMDEVREKYADDLRRGAEEPEFSRAPGGESVAEVAARMAAAANDIAGLYPSGRVLLVSHGLAVSTLFCQANNISLKKVYEFIPDNAIPIIVHWNLNPHELSRI